MERNPDEWRYPFLYAFINYVFLVDFKVAQVYFRLSAQKPTATDIPKRWAAYVTYRRIGDLRTALALWIELYNTTKNPEERAIAELYIREIKMKLDLQMLDKIIEVFVEKIGRMPVNLNELVNLGFIKEIPEEPHGEKYIIRKGKAYSTWSGKSKHIH
jgi:hypothetical protein